MPEGFDWFSYVKEGGAYCAPLLLMAIYWLLTERARLLQELKEQDTKVYALAERVVTITTELKVFLSYGRKGP